MVDDSDTVRTLIRINLELEGFQVQEADSGTRCLELVPGPDVVTLDLLLPETGPDGWTSCAGSSATRRWGVRVWWW